MDSDVKDMKGNQIYVGCKVSDGLGGGTVVAIGQDEVAFRMEGMFGNKVPRGTAFNRPWNLLVIDDDAWRRCMGTEATCS